MGAGLVLLLAPVLLPPVLPTQDGPSHLYNAFLAHRLEAGDPLFAPFLELGAALWPNRLSHLLLTSLGPWLGWEAAERVVATLAALLPFLAVAWWTRRRVGRMGGFVLAVGLWLASSWFFWKGFYDFCLSLAPFLGVVVVADTMAGRPGEGTTDRRGEGTTGQRAGGTGGEDGGPGWRRHALLQSLLAFTLLSHLLTFGVALGAAGFLLLAAVIRRRIPAHHLLAVLPGALALAVFVAGGTLGGGELQWYPWREVFDALLSPDWAAVKATASWPGRAILLALAAAPFLRWALAPAAPAGDRKAGLDAVEILALLLLAGSLVSPARVGTGQYAPERLQLLALLLLTPSAGAVARRLAERGRARWLAPAAAVALAVAFSLRGFDVVRVGQRLHGELDAMDRVLEEHGTEAGEWLVATHWNPFGPFYRTAPYTHLHDRLALERELVVLDNYEARMPIFRVQWRESPHRPEFARSIGATGPRWLVEVLPGTRPWVDPLLVLHESRYPLFTRTSLLGGGTGTDASGYAVTEIRWLGESP